MRTILHSDLNNFYASVEMTRHPELAGRPVIVCGDREERHGIVLAKNQIAKEAGIRTGDVIWEAKRKCPNVVELKADFKTYLTFSGRVRAIYEQYTDRVESFGIDECWLDVTESEGLFGSGREIAEQIRMRIKEELAVTVSIGVSYNKIFAKLGSDMKKPDAVTVITPENYRQLVWPLPVEDLLYVGRATKAKLRKYNVKTIGELACSDPVFLKERLGKWGVTLYAFANGWDASPVTRVGEAEAVKSIGNSLTNYKDMTTDAEVKALIYLLSESVAARLRESGFSRAQTVHFSARDTNLIGYGKQARLPYATRLSSEIAEAAFQLYRELFPRRIPLRGLGVSVSDFTGEYEQIAYEYTQEYYRRREKLEETVDQIRSKYGNNSIQRALIYSDKKLAENDIKGDHVIHPDYYRK